MIKLLTTFILAATFSGPIHAQVNQKPRELQNVDVVDKLGSKIPLDLKFKDEKGNDVTLAKYFNQGKPVILNLAYYECPMLCTLVLNAVADNVTKISNWKPGREYQMLTVTINPKEKPPLALVKKGNYLALLQMPPESDAWVFLSDPYNNAQTLADAIGFKYYFDKDQGQYAHPAVTFVLTEDGTLSRDLFGLTYEPKDLKFALLDASKGKIGNVIEKILLFCYHYDPDAKGYVLFAQNVMKIGGLFTILCMGLFLGFFWRMDLQRSKKVV